MTPRANIYAPDLIRGLIACHQEVPNEVWDATETPKHV